MLQSRSDIRAFLLLGFVMLFWAGNSIIGRAIRADIGPFTLALLRWGIACAIVMPFAWRGLRADWPALRRAWGIVLLLGTIGVGGFNTLLYAGLHHTTASNALLLQAGIPALVLLFDRLLFGTRASRAQVTGVILSTLGVLVIVFKGDPGAALRLQMGIGDLLVLAAVTAWAVYTVMLRLRPMVAPASFVTVTFAIGAAVLVPLAVWEIMAGMLPRWSPALGGAIAYVVIFPSIAAYFLFNAAVARIGPGRAGQAITLMPLFGALLSTLLLGERLHGYHALGMTVIVTGILVTFLGGRTTVGKD